MNKNINPNDNKHVKAMAICCKLLLSYLSFTLCSYTLDYFAGYASGNSYKVLDYKFLIRRTIKCE
jgi:hypothetical protein